MQVGDIILATEEAQREYQGLNGHKFFKIMEMRDGVIKIVSFYSDDVSLIGTINLKLFKPISEIETLNDIIVSLLSRNKKITSIQVQTDCGRTINIQ